MTDIKISAAVSIDLPKLIESRAVILANSGGGKSWLIRRLAEQAAGKIQTIILDPEGEFSTLRERFDFLHAGKDADVPAEPKSAGLLALKLLELGTSAVVDLYELHPQERQRFVKLFCDALVNCPKELYHPVLIILDEAHDYVPEGKPSEATYAVEALASKGRKRGQCLVLASQRISKLSKNAASECNNKLIGRASQDIDMKRAGDELGLSKDRLVELRQLKPGEFFAFGPAISDEVQKVAVGPVATTHAKVGYAANTRVTTRPSAAIKKVLDKLKDLPKEAEKEAQTSAELRDQVRVLKQQLRGRPEVEQVVKRVEVPVLNDKQVARLEALSKRMSTEAERHDAAMKLLWGQIKEVGTLVLEALNATKKPLNPPPAVRSEPRPIIPPRQAETAEGPAEGVSKPEQRVLDGIAWMENVGVAEPSKEIVAFLSDYAHLNSKGFTNPCGSLRSKDLIVYPRPGLIALTAAGRSLARFPDRIGSSEELHRVVLERLDGPKRRVLAPLLQQYPNEMTSEELCAAAGYAHPNSKGFTNPRGQLRSFGLIEYPAAGRVKASSILFL